MKELEEKIADLIEEWKEEKIYYLDVDNDTAFEIHNEMKSSIKHINDHLEELEDEIDGIIEQMNEPTDWEEDAREFDKMRM